MTLQETLIAEPPPLRIDECGGLRVGETRVTLDVVIHAYERGETPEQIVENFDTLDLADVYAVIGYCIKHQSVITAYLERREQEADELRKNMRPILPSRDLGDRLIDLDKARA